MKFFASKLLAALAVAGGLTAATRAADASLAMGAAPPGAPLRGTTAPDPAPAPAPSDTPAAPSPWSLHPPARGPVPARAAELRERRALPDGLAQAREVRIVYRGYPGTGELRPTQ